MNDIFFMKVFNSSDELECNLANSDSGELSIAFIKKMF